MHRIAGRRLDAQPWGLLVVVGALVSCRCAPEVPPPSAEEQLRARLGVPAEAARVLVLSQSSHLDIDWWKSFPDYYQDQVQGVFDAAGRWLDADPKAAYAVAEMGFLERYVADRGTAGLLSHAADGRLKVVGGGITSPDLLLPTEEPLIEDYLEGTLFAERVGLARPRAAWLPDSFGHPPTTPDVLSALGFSSVGFARLDGLRTPGEVNNGLSPLAEGSTAAALAAAGTNDFIWEGPGGGRVLAHWMGPKGLYCQGDTIDLDGYLMGVERLGVDQGGSRAFTSRRIRSYLDVLTPFARTPYLFVPVGCDFQRPRERLVEYAQRWNEDFYAETGTFAVVATFEDYADLVGFHRDELPTLRVDGTPYWTGFFGSRPGLKRSARVAGDALAGVEPFLWAADPSGASWREALAAAWRPVVLSNHHDFIPGTSLDPVVENEQQPMLDEAETKAELLWQEAASGLSARLATDSAPAGELVAVLNPLPFPQSGVVEVASSAQGSLVASAGGVAQPAQVAGAGRVAFWARDVPGFGWSVYALSGGAATGASASVSSTEATLHSEALDARFAPDAQGGWALVSLKLHGAELLAGPSLEWGLYTDDGGLYRIGAEMACGARYELSSVVRANKVELLESGPARATLRLTGPGPVGSWVLDVSVGAGSTRLEARGRGASPEGATVVLRVRPATPGSTLRMGAAGGAVERPLTRLYPVTYWPATRWVQRGALSVLLGASTGVRGEADGTLEWMALRNAVVEKCDLLGADGHDAAEHELSFALAKDATDTPFQQAVAALAPGRALRAVAVGRHGGAWPTTGQLLSFESEGVVPLRLKAASRGEGLVLQLYKPVAGAAALRVTPGLATFNGLSRPDLLERDDRDVGDANRATLEASLGALRLVNPSP